MERTQAYEQAKLRVEAKLGFYVHLFVFVGVNIMLAIINYMTSPEYWWAKWPLVGWGSAVIIHALFVFVFADLKVTDAMIEKEMRKSS